MKLNRHLSPAQPALAPGSNPERCRPADLPARQGIALVITLVMLSVTLVMAVAFLALARRERASVSTTTDTTTAKLAADSALATAQAQILASVLATNSGTYNFGLLVSTNFINPVGLNPASSNPTNVNYNFTSDGSLYSSADWVQNIANLEFLPRVPVFIQTNPGSPLDFRFYLDLNRNGQFDDTGNNIENVLENGTIPGIFSAEVGDPQWVGILSHPELTHSANNLFVSRYSFIAVPIGNDLDLNAIHNQPYNASGQTVDNNYADYEKSAYLRNEGVGSWEINLAAFLADLNTNQWDIPGAGNDYNYNEPEDSANMGAPFDDALSILSHRYNYAFAYLSPLSSVFTNYAQLQNQPFDLNLAGRLLTGTPAQIYVNNTSLPWAGSVNTNHFYDLPSELFNPAESSPKFTSRLLAAGIGNGTTNPATYDRYTFYRLLAQMGTDSDPDDGRMNLNFRNMTNGVVVPGMETNCYAWSPLDFFTNAADRMLRLYSTNWFGANPLAYFYTYYGLVPGDGFTPGSYYEGYTNASGNFVTNDPTGFGLRKTSSSPFLNWTNQVPAIGITNIPVYVNGQFVYSPAVNRLLQLAANLYEASTNEPFPQVFRPIFEMDQFTNLFIVGFTSVAGVNPAFPGSDGQFSPPIDVSQLGTPPYNSTYIKQILNVYGVPWIIGAKTNLPSFNQFTLLNSVQVTRKLQLIRASVNAPIYTNHMYEVSISNSVSASFWNSYSNGYTAQLYPANSLSVIFSDIVSMATTNSDHPGVYGVQVFTNGYTMSTNFWPGSSWSHKIGEAPQNASLLTMSFTNTFFPTNAPISAMEIYKTGVGQFVTTNDPDPWESNNISCNPLPQMALLTTNWMRAIIVDNGHVIDYVQVRGPLDGTNFTATLNDTYPAPSGNPYLWLTNLNSGGLPWGYVNQIAISEGDYANNLPNGQTWQPVGYPGGSTSKADDTTYFLNFFNPGNPFLYQGQTSHATNLVVQAGYTASRTVFVPYLYQANDPLVHYLASDLNAGTNGSWHNEVMPNGIWVQNNAESPLTPYPIPVPPQGGDIIKGRYQPWGYPALVPASAFNYAEKDPGVWDPDYWMFPTNLYPTVGWIGRVHRGTPWQTVYLKPNNIIVPGNNSGVNVWAAWTGNGNYYDASNSAPVEDRLLFDLFTTRPNDNAAYGTLSVNQTNLAAWSAIFSGMVALTNTIPTGPRYPILAGNYIPINTNSYYIIPPAGVNGAASPLAQLVAAINTQRAVGNPALGFTNLDGVVGAFEHAGDILSVPALTVQSPFLNWSNNYQQAYGINDAEYEWLPQQMMGLVRESSAPRYVIYGYGQALRPAPNGLVTSGNNFGLVTNYQVVAESAVRAVVSVHPQVNLSGAYPVTNYTTRVESYNVLPSD